MKIIVTVVVTTINLFFVAFILAKKNKSLPDAFLIILNILVASLLASNSFTSDQVNTLIFFFQSFIPFLIFPFFFLVVYSFIHDGNFNVYWLLIFTVAIMYLIFFMVDHWILHDYSRADIRSLYNKPPWSYHIFYKSNQIFNVAMSFVLLKHLYEYEKAIKNEFSYIERIEARWLRHSVYVYLFISATTLTLFLSSNLGILPIDIDSVYRVLDVIVLLAIIYVNFKGIQSYSAHKYNEILQPTTGTEEQITTAQENKKANTANDKQPSKLDNNKARLSAIYDKIIHALESEKLYLTPQLKLNDLSNSIDETFHLCSNAINAIGNTSFYDLVNKYRVAYFKEQLALPENDHLTILAIGLDSGFNSKASLNRIFKNHEGVSPHEYKIKLDHQQ